MNDDPMMQHMKFEREVALSDVVENERKEQTYRGSWKKRGGVGAFMMLCRKWDRLENMLQTHHHDNAGKYDIFGHIAQDPTGSDGTVLAELRDLRRYLLHVESEMVARGVVVPSNLITHGQPKIDLSQMCQNESIAFCSITPAVAEKLVPVVRDCYESRGDRYALSDFIPLSALADLRTKDPKGIGQYYLAGERFGILIRSNLTDEELEQRVRFPFSLNDYEWTTTPSSVKELYMDDELRGHTMKTAYFDHWCNAAVES